MIKKILKLSAINTLSAGLNFLSTIIIVKSFGLAILGEFTVFNAFVSLLLLAYIVLPVNYSVFKLQDGEDYLQYFNFNYLSISLLLIPFVFVIDFFDFFTVNGVLLYFFILFLGLQNYFDTFFQAKNQLKTYFLSLFVISFIRFCVLVYLYLSNYNEFTLNLLIEIYLVSQALVLSVLVYLQRRYIFNSPLIHIEHYIKYLNNNFSLLRSYYFGTVIKRLKDNSLVLLFSVIVSSETIGLYALFVKVGSVVLGQVRVFEAFLMNRSNLEKMNSLKETPLFVGFFMQMILMGVGLLYLKINTGSYYFMSLFMYSFIVYPYLQTVLSRSRLLSQYNNTAINQSYLVYILLIGILFVIANMMKIESLNFILLTTLLGELLIGQTLVFKLRKQNG